MPHLADSRQDLYCQHRARGMIPAQAAIAAGYAAGSGITTKLEETPEIIARIGELMEEIQVRRLQAREAAIAAAKTVGESTGMTRAWIIQQLVENAILARQDGDFKESNVALKLIGDEYGMFKGASSLDDLEHVTNKTIDLAQTEALLAKAHEVLTPKPKQITQEETAIALDLISGNRKQTVTASQRKLSTGSETDVALTASADPTIEE
jgi:phage terminase small subunit